MTTPSQPPAPRTVRCPTCGGPSLYAPENRYRPFCSERCKLQDLGAWASESFRLDAGDGEAGASAPTSHSTTPEGSSHSGGSRRVVQFAASQSRTGTAPGKIGATDTGRVSQALR